MGGNPVIVDAVRTPVGRAVKGSLASVRPDDLGAHVVRALIERTGVERSEVDELVCGCGYPWGEQGYNVGRGIALLAGLPSSVPAQTVTRMCASSLQAIRIASHMVEVGEGDIFVCCGVESCSRAGRDFHLADPNPALKSQPDGTDYYVPMLMTAENVARKFDVPRDEMDAFAQRSHDRALAAQDSGAFDREIVPVVDASGRIVDLDDGPRRDSSLEALASLPVLTGDDGRITAGNSCPLSDGASAVLVTSEERARTLGLAPRARVIASGVSGIDPDIMGVAPIEAVQKALNRARMTMDDVDVFELNEAFAAQVLPTVRALGMDPFDECLNPRGGAIALGHPFGMTGARIMTTLLGGLEARDGSIGLEAMCVGGGQGQAMVIERLS
jgi:acetyl-CoA C-acetyltransferase